MKKKLIDNWEKEFNKFYIRITPLDKHDETKAEIFQRMYDSIWQKEKTQIKDFIIKLLTRQRKEIAEGVKWSLETFVWDESLDGDEMICIMENRKKLNATVLSRISP